jgi:hypothetical protein
MEDIGNEMGKEIHRGREGERMFAREKKGEECLLRDKARGKERENEGSKEKECV